MSLDTEAEALAGLLDHEMKDIVFCSDLPGVTHHCEELDHLMLFGWAHSNHLESFPKGWNDFFQSVLHDGCDQKSVEVLDEFQHRFLRSFFVEVMELIHEECDIVFEPVFIQDFDELRPVQGCTVTLTAAIGLTVAVVNFSEAPTPLAVAARISGHGISVFTTQRLQ